MAFFSSAFRHRFFGNQGYNIPKPKFLYYVTFSSVNFPRDIGRQVSFFVKRSDRIRLSYNLEEKNQYNKKRLIQTKVKYDPINLVFHDTVDSSALRMIEAYNRFYYNDFQGKNPNSWLYDISGAEFEPTGSWGLKGTSSPNNQHFFDSVNIYEFYDQTYSKVSFINPLISNIEFDQLDQESSMGNELSVSLNYEGIVLEAISQQMTQDVADILGIPLVNDGGFEPFSSFGNVLGNATDSFLGDIVSQQGNFSNFADGFTSSVDRAVNVLTGGLETEITGFVEATGSRVFGNASNSLLGARTSFDSFSTVSNTFSSVASRSSSAGSAIKDISTGFIGDSIDSVGDSLDSFLKF